MHIWDIRRHSVIPPTPIEMPTFCGGTKLLRNPLVHDLLEKKKSVVSFQKITLLYHERDGCEKLTYHLSSCHWQPVKRGSSVDEPAIIANEARWAMQRFYNASGLFFASCPISMILNETQEFVHAMCLAGQLLRFEGCCFTFSRSAQVIPKLGSCIQLPSSSAHGTLD